MYEIDEELKNQVLAKENVKRDKFLTRLNKFVFALVVLIIALMINVGGFVSVYSYKYFYSDAKITVNVKNAPEGLYYIDMFALAGRGENGGATYNHQMYNGDYENGKLDEELSGYNREMIEILRNYEDQGNDDARLSYRSRFGGYDAKDPIINVSNEEHTYKFTNTVPKSFYIIMVTEDKQTIVSKKIILRSKECNVTFDAQSGKLKQKYPTDLIFMPVMFIILLLSMMYTRCINRTDFKLLAAANAPFLLLNFVFFHIFMNYVIVYENIGGLLVFTILTVSVIVENMGEALIVGLVKREKDLFGYYEWFVFIFGYSAFGWAVANILTFVVVGIGVFLFG